MSIERPIFSFIQARGYPARSLEGTDAVRLVSLLPGPRESELRCHLISSNLKDAPQYEALSYAWGDTSNAATIIIQDPAGKAEAQHLNITASSAAALRRLRHERNDHRLIWIDQVCINQTDIPERNHQVSLMTQIYDHAQRVIVYLGEAADDSNEAMDFIRDVHAPEDHQIDEWSERPVSKGLQDLFKRPWFNRIWVLQEVAMARDTVVYCGDRSVDWEAFMTFGRYNDSMYTIRNMPHVIRQEMNRARDWYEAPHPLKKLIDSRPCEASDPRDKIYAILPLVAKSGDKLELSMWWNLEEDIGWSINIVPDYALSAAAVYADFAAKCMKTLGPELLCQAQKPSKVEGLPSWVPDWSVTPRYGSLGFRSWARRSPYSAGGKYTPEQKSWESSEIRPGVFQLKSLGIHVGRISSLGSAASLDDSYLPLIEWNQMAIRANPQVEYRVIDGTKWAWDPVESVDGLAPFARVLSVDQAVYHDALQIGLALLYDHDAGKDSLAPFNTSLIQRLGHSYGRAVLRTIKNCDNHRFAIVDEHKMSLVPAAATEGDLICILLGASVPFVLRPDGDGYRLLGECYLYGVMQGGALPENRTDESPLHELQQYGPPWEVIHIQ